MQKEKEYTCEKFFIDKYKTLIYSKQAKDKTVIKANN